MKRKKLLIVLGIIFVLIAGTLMYFSTFKLKNVNVTGCNYSSPEEIEQIVRDNAYMDNTILLYWKSKFKKIKGIPFVAKLEIEFKSKDTVNVIVFEKKIAGCFEYMESYVYFDKDGIILETSKEKKAKVPLVEGLEFESWEKGEKLPLADETKFNYILTIVQLTEKYSLALDGIEFTPEGNIILNMGKIDVEVGDGSYLAVQMMNLGSIITELGGKSGVLYMKDFSSSDGVASFKTREMIEAEEKKAAEEKERKEKEEKEAKEKEEAAKSGKDQNNKSTEEDSSEEGSDDEYSDDEYSDDDYSDDDYSEDDYSDDYSDDDYSDDSDEGSDEGSDDYSDDDSDDYSDEESDDSSDDYSDDEGDNGSDEGDSDYESYEE